MLDRDGDKIGKIDDDLPRTGRPGSPSGRWSTPACFGTKKTLRAAARRESPTGEDVRVPLEKAHVKDAPGIDADRRAQRERGARALHATTTSVTTTRPTFGVAIRYGQRRTTRLGRHTTGRRDDALRGGAAALGTERREAGRARLRKYVGDRDASSARVPVRREEVRVEREPITEGNGRRQALDGRRRSPSEEHEVVALTRSARWCEIGSRPQGARPELSAERERSRD